MVDDFSLKGKTVLVTGGASGIGRATALVCAERGAAIALADIAVEDGETVCEQIREMGGSAYFVCADMARPEAVEAMIETVIDTFGKLDGAFNNAGVVDQSRSMVTSTQENWDRLMSVNLEGTWHCLRLELEHMAANSGGSIVNCSSRAGLVGVPTDAIYGATKHAVVGLTKSAALEFGPKGVRVNAVCPGTVDTPLVRSRFELNAEGFATARNPLGRVADPREIGNAVAWLLSDAASFVTGVALPVDGGATAG